MNLILQDVIVTAMALGAVGLVVRRVVGVFSPPPSAPACHACSSCPAPRAVPHEAGKAAPMTLVTGGSARADRRQP